MATSITQAKPLLTAAELELFDQSRAEPIKSLTEKQLGSKITRTRTLRDKYRDLYRRQTVAQRGKAAATTDAADKANARTQRKSEIMEEMLERFEARSALLASRAERDSGRKPAKTTGSKAGKTTAATSRKAAAVKSGSPPKAVAKTSAKSPAKPKKLANGATSARVPAKAASKGVSSRQPKTTEAPLSAMAHLRDGAQEAVQVEHLTGQDPVERSHKAPSDSAPTHGGKADAPYVNAPLDMLPSARRENPVRNSPGNIAIQGHVSSSVRRAQGKKDSRE